MKRLRTSLSKKLKGNAGESIAEVLIALLIAALALTMLASVITSAAKMINRSKQLMNAYYAENEWLSAQADSAADGALTVTVSTVGSESEPAREVKLIPGGSITVKYQDNDIVSDEDHNGIHVIAFWKAG